MQKKQKRSQQKSTKPKATRKGRREEPQGYGGLQSMGSQRVGHD